MKMRKKFEGDAGNKIIEIYEKNNKPSPAKCAEIFSEQTNEYVHPDTVRKYFMSVNIKIETHGGDRKSASKETIAEINRVMKENEYDLTKAIENSNFSKYMLEKYSSKKK